MQKKLLRTYIIIISITIIITVFISWRQINSAFFKQVENRAISEIELLHDLFVKLDKYDGKIISDFTQDYSKKSNVRITVIDVDGEVIADSDSNILEMDNHKYREEISQALETGEINTSMRYSKTMGMYYQYVAIPVNLEGFTGVLRTSTPVKEIKQFVTDMISVIIGGIILGSIVAFIIAYLITRKIVNPISELTNAAIEISEGNYEEKIYINEKDEIGKLAKAFNNMTSKLRINMNKLEHQNAELESILRSMSNGIIVIDDDFKIVLFNDNFLKMFNIKDKNIKGKPFYEVTRNLFIFEFLEKSKNERKNTVKEAKFYDKSGEKIYLINVNPIRSKENTDKILGSLLVVQDVTQIRKLENMRSDFVSNVTHELKTPLTSIRGFVDTLKNGALDDAEVAAKFLDIIKIEAERLEGLIQDILVLSEIEAMGEDKNVKDESIPDIIEETVEILKPELEKKDLEIKLDIDSNVSNFRCNKNRIKQLLINIIGNSIKYTENGFIKISCKEDFINLVIEVQDTGIGIDKKHIPRLFERFYRIDKGRSRKQGGTGLGLSIVKHIVELYNGQIKVKSKVGKGTTMTICIPYKK